jgi:hypothetical protein
MRQINRDDMLELTRRFTSARSNLVRIAGAYIDEEGYIDGTFNTSFLSLKGAEKNRCLDIAKAIPFAKPNDELIQYKIPGLEAGFLYPAFTNRSTDLNHVNFYSQDYEESRELMKFLNISD